MQFCVIKTLATEVTKIPKPSLKLGDPSMGVRSETQMGF